MPNLTLKYNKFDEKHHKSKKNSQWKSVLKGKL